jgi:ABC-2 type transport system ATP-binding protein
MIEVDRLWKTYGEVVAVKDVSFQVREGEILGFLGPNGAGKTTTMRILTCFMPATRGRVRVAGFDVARDSMAVRRSIGYLPEIPPLYPDMTVEEYLRFVARLKGVEKSQASGAVDRAIEVCGLAEMRRRHIHKLSKGYRQRTGLAQALIHDPKVLILDEPTIGLDPRQIAEIRKLIKGLAGARTVILSTHILHEVTLTCQRAIIINQGHIVFDGDLQGVNEVFAQSKVIKLQLSAPVSREDLEVFGVVREHSEFTATIQIPRLDLKEISKVILDQLPVVDFNIEDIPIEEGIALLYQRQEPVYA